MRKILWIYAIFITIGFLSLGAYIVRAQTSGQAQPRISVDNRGLKTRVETLEGLVTTLQGQVQTQEGLITTLQGQVQTQEGLITALQAKQAVLVTGQVYDYRQGHEQLTAQIGGASQLPVTRMIWVCAPSEPTAEKQITRDQFITNAGLENARKQAQIDALLAE